MTVRIFEVFTSIEGEGILYATKTLFVRLAGCPFTCSYCDTKDSLPLDSGTEYTMRQATDLIDETLQDHTYKVNFTGGDPLLQHNAVALLAGHVRARGVLTYLESSCFDSDRFAHVLPHIDIAKIEFKTSDSGFVTKTRHDKMIGEALRCLELAVGADKTVYIKLVVGSSTPAGEVRRLASAVFELVPREAISGFVIQPVHGSGAPSLDHLLEIYDLIRPIYADIRVVPQLHKIINAP